MKRLLPVLALVLLASSCTTADEPGEPDPGTESASSTTDLSGLPSAIVGQGGTLEGTDLHYVDGDALTTGYLAVPEGDGPFPALVIIHEWNGLVDRVRQLADDFAAEGYVTLAADMYKGQTGSNQEENIALMTAVNDDPGTMIANLNAAVSYLRGRDDVTGRVGTMGWCFGGGVALSFGLDGENHEATAMFYGRVLDDPEVVGRMDHEVYGTFAELDQSIPPEAVASFAAALRAAGVENDIHVYDDVQHGFWLRVDGDPDVRGAAAVHAWERLKAYLNRTLGA